MVALLAILRWAALAFSLSVRYLTKRRRWAVTSADVPFVSCARRWRETQARVFAATACLGPPGRHRRGRRRWRVKQRTPHVTVSVTKGWHCRPM
jgi:hypothetical protein